MISTNEELGLMEIVLVTMEKKFVEAYSNIFRLAGYNPVVIDLAPLLMLILKNTAWKRRI